MSDDYYTEADLHRDLGITESKAGIDEVFQKSLGINATEEEREEAMRRIAADESSPWRFEWPAGERWSRRGEELELANAYTARLGESASAAEAHVHRVLSAAWTSNGLSGVREALASESTRMGAVTPLTPGKDGR